jgi:hypothetical protein
MNLKERIVSAFLGPTIEAEVKKRLAASSFVAPDVEEARWRRLSGNASRELVPTTQDRMIEIAYWLNETNPLAGWLIDITTSFILAEGLPYESKDDDVKEVLDGFWNDPINRMDLYFPKHVDELHIFGELCFPVFVAKQTGRVRLGYVDPANIGQVITDPENVKMQIGVLTKGWIGDVGGYQIEADPKKYRTILPEESEFVLSRTAKNVREQLTDGECFYFSINNVTNSPRGRSSLLSVSDWLDAYEQYLFDFADRWPLMNSFVWDLVVDGGTPDTIKEQVNNFTKKSGSVFGHNEKVTAEAKAPDLKAVDAEAGSRMFRNHIMGRFGYPEHWYGGGGDVNRATAAEMDAPAIKMLSRKQNYVKYVLESILSYQVRMARESRYLRSDGEFTVITPQMQAKDITKHSAAIQQVAAALVSAETQGWLDTDTARKVFAALMEFAGVEIDLEEVKKAVEKQKETEGYEDYIAKKDEEMRRSGDEGKKKEIVAARSAFGVRRSA